MTPQSNSMRDYLRLRGMQHGRPMPVSRPRPVRMPERAARDPLEQARGIYRAVESSGLYIAPERDVKLGKGKSVSLDAAGKIRGKVHDEEYNSTLLGSILTAIIGNSMVFFGPKGTGKTTVAEIVGSSVYGMPQSVVHEATIYGHPELTEEKMTARPDIARLAVGEWKIHVQNFAKSPVKIIDEVNRIPPEKLSILYQLVDRAWVVYQGQKIISPAGPLFATANAKDSGNFELPPPFLDRFGLGTISMNLNPYFLSQLGERKLENITLTEAERAMAREQINCIPFEEGTLARLAHFLAEMNYCENAALAPECKSKAYASARKPGPLCQSCHFKTGHNICHVTEEGLSARSYQSVIAYSKALAWWRGKPQVGEEELSNIAPYNIWFKLGLTRSAFEKDERFANDRIGLARDLLATSQKSFERAKLAFPDYESLCQRVAEGGRFSSSEFQHLCKGLRDVDSPAKYGMYVALCRRRE